MEEALPCSIADAPNQVSEGAKVPDDRTCSVGHNGNVGPPLEGMTSIAMVTALGQF